MSWAAGAGDRARARAGSHGVVLLARRPRGKEEALCRLQEENQQLSREQQRVSRAGRGPERQAGGGTEAGSRQAGWAELPGLRASHSG